MERLCLILFLCFCLNLQAQEVQQQYTLSLEEAVALGLEKNYAAQISQKEVEIALKQKWEIISQGLPQLNGSVDYQNFIKQPVTLIPGEIAGGDPGTSVPVSFGTKQSLSATGTWQQLIFDGSYIVGVQSAKTLLQISRNAKIKTDLEVKKAVINAYGNVLLSEESVEILRKNLGTLQKNLSDTEKIYQNGLAEEEDVEQLKITSLGLENNLNRALQMREIAYQMLNMALGIPIESEVTLTEDLNALAAESLDLRLLERSIPLEENIDVKIAGNTAEAAEIYLRLEKAKALPSLTGFLNYGWTGYNEKFRFFSSEQDYFSQSILGISLNVPIFSSGMRSARTAQKRLEYEQALLEFEETRNRVALEIASARSDYRYKLENYRTLQENLRLAERIEEKNEIKFFEGLASSFELRQAQTQLYAAQQDLLQAMLDVITSKVELETKLDVGSFKGREDMN